jgi:hypothetical protein
MMCPKSGDKEIMYPLEMIHGPFRTRVLQAAAKLEADGKQ